MTKEQIEVLVSFVKATAIAAAAIYEPEDGGSAGEVADRAEADLRFILLDPLASR